MEKISKHISELLFDHDCVIVPSLGGFLASNENSRVLLPNHLIFPPYRRIAFNVYLKQSDGLLANHLMESESIPYAEASYLIDSFANECFENLEKGKKVSIAEVGSLYYDKEKNIQFEAFRNFNHLRDSFGMEAVHFIPVQREEVIEKKKAIQPSIRASVPSDEKKKQIKVSLKSRRYIGAAVLTAGIILFALNLYLVAPKHYESTSLNPFDSQEIIISKTDSIRNIPSDSEQNTIAQNGETSSVAVPEESTAFVIPADTTDADKTTVSETGNQQVIPENQSQTTIPVTEPVSILTNKLYIIAGVFKVSDNARFMLLSLKQQGFTNAIIIENNGLNYVSYEAFTNKEDALAITDSLKRLNLDGWIWKH